MADKPIGKFPSPIGELHFSIANKVVVRLYEKVSVPYRGATFLNQYEDVSKLDGETVSVPYRGATFLNKSMKTQHYHLSRKFPSPIGELHFSILKYGRLDNVFVVSVPYRGATFLNRPEKSDSKSNKSFRPLSGSYISQ